MAANLTAHAIATLITEGTRPAFERLATRIANLDARLAAAEARVVELEKQLQQEDVVDANA